MDIRKYLEKNRIIADGGMGTYYDSLTDYQGDMVEKANLMNPDKICRIHRDYLDAGANLIRTNTFAVNSMFFDTDEIEQCLSSAWEQAKAAVTMSGREDVWIAADMGPIYESETKDGDAVRQEYVSLVTSFLNMGAEVFVFETLSELLYLKEAISLIKKCRPDAFIIVQFSFNKNGFTKTGMSVTGLLAESAAVREIDAVGFNCGVGPGHLYELLKEQAFPDGKYLTALPNAGYPMALRGRALYSANVPYYVEMMGKIASLGMDILGGCCGTTPEHIKGISQLVREGKRPPKKLMPLSLMQKKEAGDRTEIVTPFMQKLLNGEKVFAVELDPPFDADDRKLTDGTAVLKAIHVDMMTVADSPLARPRADAVASAIKMHYTQHMAVMPHISCRDKNTIGLRAQFLGMQMNDIRHALIVTGDPIARGDRESIKSVFNFNSIKLMQYLQTMNREVFKEKPIYYGGALNQHNGSIENIANRMKQKMAAGAAWFLTQPVYGQTDIDRIHELKEKSGGRILVGIMPLVSRKNALFIRNEMPGIRVPDEVLERYQEGMSREEYEAVAIDISLDLMRRLGDDCDGYYLMTPFNRVSLIEKIIMRAKKELT